MLRGVSSPSSDSVSAAPERTLSTELTQPPSFTLKLDGRTHASRTPSCSYPCHGDYDFGQQVPYLTRDVDRGVHPETSLQRFASLFSS